MTAALTAFESHQTYILETGSLYLLTSKKLERSVRELEVGKVQTKATLARARMMAFHSQEQHKATD